VTVLFNGADLTVENTGQTWGDFMSALDVRLSADGQIMTSVRIDGVEEPAFREPSLRSRDLATFSSIEIESGRPDVLARRSLADAASALDDLRAAGRSIADQLRGYDVADGLRGLEKFSQSLLMVLRVVAAAGIGLRRELESPEQNGLSIGAVSSQLDGIVREMMDAQQSEDWLRLADILEFDLDPMLGAWQQSLLDIAAR
jgi:hypothetical protein